MFNSQRSLELWDQVHSDRMEMLSQVALCVILCRYQVRSQRHVHWEQPEFSLMLRLPYLQEIFGYLKVAKPDMCIGGELRDPQNQRFMKKGMSIVTSSKTMHSALDHLKCKGSHEHQPIEGSTTVHGMTADQLFRSCMLESLPDWSPRRYSEHNFHPKNP